MEGLGPHQFWGSSPALDVVSEYHASVPSAKKESELNVLVVGSGDIRHALKTMATARRHNQKVNIFMYDQPTECVARHMLLLAILTDWAIPIRQRANLFLEVFGNCLVQERTSKYIAKLGQDLVQFVCNGHGSLKRLVNLSHLKFRETDQLETIFKSWGESVDFNMKELRDKRLRVHYGQRFDHRQGLIDWDYQEGVKPQHSIIHYKLYKHWRETGVAFEFGDQTYTMPNKSMASYAKGKEGGVSRMRRGFWSDIVMSPYFSLGVDCEQPNQHAKDLFKIIGEGTPTEQHRHNCVHVAVYNLLSFMHEIETKKRYQMKKAHDVFSGLDTDDNPQDKKAFAMECAKAIMDVKDRVTITMLTGDHIGSLFAGKMKYKDTFDMVWLSNHNAHLIKEPYFGDILRSKGPSVVCIETARNMVTLKKDKKQEFCEKVVSLAQSLKFAQVKLTDAPGSLSDHEILTFVQNKQ